MAGYAYDKSLAKVSNIIAEFPFTFFVLSERTVCLGTKVGRLRSRPQSEVVVGVMAGFRGHGELTRSPNLAAFLYQLYSTIGLEERQSVRHWPLTSNKNACLIMNFFIEICLQ